LSGLAIVGSLALSATVAQAGAGGSPTFLSGFFVCHEAAGNAPAVQNFDVLSQDFGPLDAQGTSILQRIKLGKAALACAFAKLFPVPTQATPNPDPIEPGTGSETQMTCYPITLPQTNKVKTPYDAGDVLVPEATVTVPPTQLRFLCAPATFFQPSD
jgi:hypothetical protein